jgi:hypothetical protein
MSASITKFFVPMYLTIALAGCNSVSEISLAGSEQDTHLGWTYSFLPKAWPEGRFISQFVPRDFRGGMEATLTQMQAQACFDLRTE